jgi:hypothetical protein
MENPMTTLRFDSDGVRKIADHMMASKDWSKGFGEKGEPRPQIIFVKDEGIYLMSNGKPHLPGTERQNFCVYAQGYDPNKDSDVWDNARAAVGGDDFAEYISLAPAQLHVIQSGAPFRFSIKVTPKTLAILVTPVSAPRTKPSFGLLDSKLVR